MLLLEILLTPLLLAACAPDDLKIDEG